MARPVRDPVLDAALASIRNRDRLLARAGRRLQQVADTLELHTRRIPATKAPELFAVRNQLRGMGRELEWLGNGALDPPRRRRIDLVRVARELVDEWNRRRRGPPMVQLHTRDRSLVGSWDVAHLGSLLAELVSNALKFSEGSPVLVTVSAPDENTASVFVESRGAVPLPRPPFRRFIRGPHARGEGMGVGLWLTDTIAKSNGGRLRFRRADGGGVRAEVRLVR
jgi:signal transduction histidine kinase